MEEEEERTPYQPVGWTQELEESNKIDPAYNRPLGVSILAVLDMTGALILIAFLIFSQGPAGLPTENGRGIMDIEVPKFIVWLEVAGAVASSIGLWMLFEWGRLLTICRSVLGIIILLVMNATQMVTGGLLLLILISVAVIAYLSQLGVREVFRSY